MSERQESRKYSESVWGKAEVQLLPCLLCGETPTWYAGKGGKFSLWHTCSGFFDETVHFKLGDKVVHTNRWNERMK